VRRGRAAPPETSPPAAAGPARWGSLAGIPAVRRLPQDREGRGQGLRPHLEGRVSWVEHVPPARGAALRAELDRIAW